MGENMKKSGIYCIENLINGKKYIGQSVDLKRREYRHFSELRGSYHYNSHLQRAFNKYGKKSFKFKILIYCESFELTIYEQYFVDSYVPEILYNNRLECIVNNLGISHSKETKDKIAKSLEGHFVSKKTREKLSKANTGRKYHSEKTKKMLSKINTGENHPQSKLTENQVFEILDLYHNKKYTQLEISKLFPVTRRTVGHIIRGNIWNYCYSKFITDKRKNKNDRRQNI